MREIKSPSKGLSEILAAESEADVAEVLLTLPKQDRKSLAKELKAALGGKTARLMSIGAFTPETTVLWEKTDIDTVVDELKRYLSDQWNDDQYIELTK